MRPPFRCVLHDDPARRGAPLRRSTADREVPPALVRRDAGGVDDVLAVFPGSAARRVRLRAPHHRRARAARTAAPARRAPRHLARRDGRVDRALALADSAARHVEADGPRVSGRDAARRARRRDRAAVPAARRNGSAPSGLVYAVASGLAALASVRVVEPWFARRFDRVSGRRRTAARVARAGDSLVHRVHRLCIRLLALRAAADRRVDRDRTTGCRGRTPIARPHGVVARACRLSVAAALRDDERVVSGGRAGPAVVDPAARVVSGVVHRLLLRRALVFALRVDADARADERRGVRRPAARHRRDVRRSSSRIPPCCSRPRWRVMASCSGCGRRRLV